MVRLIDLACPSCGARIQVPKGQEESRCEYCLSTFRMADRVAPPPVSAPPGHGAGPRVVRPRSGAVWVSTLVPLLVALGVATYYMGMFRGVVTQAESTARSATQPSSSVAGGAEATPSRPQPMVAGNRQPMLYDVDGDGTLDAIVWVQYPLANLATHLAAYDPKRGAQLWESEMVVDSSQDGWRIESFLVGDRILLTDLGGGLRALSAKTGGEVWRAPMTERVEEVCFGDEEGVVFAVLADKRVVRVTLATGAFEPSDHSADRTACPYAWSSTAGENPAAPVDQWRRFGLNEPEIDGMRVDHSLHDLAGGRAYALGTRNPGTRVPTVAAYDRTAREKKRKRRDWVKVQPLWVRAVPGIDPLKVAEGDPPTAAFADGRLYVPYELAKDTEGWRVACIDATSGETRWDEPLPDLDTDDVQTLSASATHVFVTHWKGMSILDAATGALLHRIDSGR